tara:strand:- start:128 stop:436 length:309 start_codon:yes stop_codon:yes gene_type:complete
MSEESKLADKYEKATQFSQEELDKIKEIQKSYVGIQQAFGQLEVNKLRLEQQIKALDIASNNLKEKFSEIQDSEQKLIEEFNGKYGDGTLDLESGTFTPNKS